MTTELTQENELQNKLNRFQKFEIYADMEHVNETWTKHGHYTAPMAVRDAETGQFIKATNNQVWWQHNNFQDVLNASYTLYPNEEADYMVNSVLETKLQDLDLKLYDTVTSHNGRTKYWKILSEKEYKVSTLPDGRDDTVRIGCVVRNGMGTGVALGIDLFTFRVVCSNGAVAKGRDLGSVMWRHVGKEQKMIAGFEEGFRQTVHNVNNIIKIYEKSDTIAVNSKIASRMYQNLWWLGETYLPETWNIKKLGEIEKMHKAKLVKGNDELITVKKEVSLWDTFNQITQNQRDRLNQKRVSFGNISYQQNKLHQSMIQIVNERQRGLV